MVNKNREVLVEVFLDKHNVKDLFIFPTAGLLGSKGLH